MLIRRAAAGARKLHLWLGWALAAWLLMLALTGGALLFKDEILAATAPGCAAGRPASLEQSLRIVDDRFAGRVRFLIPAGGAFCHHQVIFRDQQGGAYIDPVTLRTVATWRQNGRPTDVLLELHRHLLMADAGKLPTALLAGAAFLQATVGLALALLRHRALSLRVWPLALRPGALLASHRNLGGLVALPLMFLAFSGWAMTYPKLSKRLFAAEASQPAGSGGTSATISWGLVLHGASAAFPRLPPTMVTWPAGPGEPVVLRFRQSGEWQPRGQSSATLDGAGRLIARTDALAEGPGFKAWGALYPLHSGKVAGWLGLSVVGVTAFGLVWLLTLGLGANLLRAKLRDGRPGRPIPGAGITAM